MIKAAEGRNNNHVDFVTVASAIIIIVQYVIPIIPAIVNKPIVHVVHSIQGSKLGDMSFNENGQKNILLNSINGSILCKVENVFGVKVVPPKKEFICVTTWLLGEFVLSA